MKYRNSLLVVPAVIFCALLNISCESDTPTEVDEVIEARNDAKTELPDSFQVGDVVTVTGEQNGETQIFTFTFSDGGLLSVDQAGGFFASGWTYTYEKEGDNFAVLSAAATGTYSLDVIESFLSFDLNNDTDLIDTINLGSVEDVANVWNAIYRDVPEIRFAVSGEGDLFLIESVYLDFDDQLSSKFTVRGQGLFYTGRIGDDAEVFLFGNDLEYFLTVETNIQVSQ